MTEPTDAELDTLIDEVAGLDSSDEALRAFARAVLQRWGQPSGAGEPVALLVRKNSWRDGQWEAAPPNSPSYGLGWANQRVYVYTTPQPTQPQAGAVPQGWKAVPVNPTPEMWKAAKTVPDPNPPYPPHYGLVWDAMLAAAPSIEQGGQHG